MDEKFREVLAQDSIHEKKEFLRGLVAGIRLFPSENRGVIMFYDLIPASFKCSAGRRLKVYSASQDVREAVARESAGSRRSRPAPSLQNSDGRV
jgi:hypothetical protein